MHGLTLEARNARTRAHRTVAQRREDGAVERRMHRGRTAFRGLQPVFPPWPNLEADHRPQSCFEHKGWRVAQPLISRACIELVDRPAPNDLWQDVIGLAH